MSDREIENYTGFIIGTTIIFSVLFVALAMQFFDLKIVLLGCMLGGLLQALFNMIKEVRYHGRD